MEQQKFVKFSIDFFKLSVVMKVCFVINDSIRMKKVSQRQLTDHVKLVSWEEKKQLQKFNLLTIHSLLLDSNPKFQELKQIIQNFNKQLQKGIDRKHLQYKFTQRLYDMLSQLVMIPVYQNQYQFLQKLYEWSRQGGREEPPFCQEEKGFFGSKSRPTTASTRTRAFSAYSRPKSGYPTAINSKNKPPSIQNILRLEQQVEKKKPLNRQNPQIDYQKLESGDMQFYNGTRTLHPQQQPPKKQLKSFQRKVFYEEQLNDSDLQVLDLGDQGRKQEKQFFYQPPQQQINQNQAQQEGRVEGQEQTGEENGNDQAFGLEAEDDVNIDDIPLEGAEDQFLGQGQQKVVVDKLKPKLKAFISYQTQLSKNKINYHGGEKQFVQHRNTWVKKKAQDEFMTNKMTQWALDKSRTIREQRRRAESARIATKRIGISYRKPQKLQQNLNMVNLNSIPVFQTKAIRPKSTFTSENPKNRKQFIQNCFMTSKLAQHIPSMELQSSSQLNKNATSQRISSVAQKPKKKTFQDIMREATAKVKHEELLEIQQVKEKFAKSKVPFENNRIAKSVTYHVGGEYEEKDQRYDEEFTGQITGMNMMKNPFFKVGKKKKKKKKKK